MAAAALVAAALPAQSQLANEVTVDGCIFYLNGANNVTHGDADCNLVLAHFTENDLGADPGLTDPYNTTSPDFVPTNAIVMAHYVENLLPAHNAAECGAECGCDLTLEQACYKGAIPPASDGDDWTEGWTYYNFDGDGRTDIDYGKPLVILEGQYAADLTLSGANNYLLRGRVGIDAGNTLTIPAGTVLFGENATAGYIVIERGADIMALGTAADPIIMTSDQAPGEMARGGWGGLVIHGRAVANCADCLGGDSCASEGAAGDFCGDDDCDDSGTVRYVRVEYSGVEISLDNELNCFTFNAVGCNTTAEFLQAHMGSDDLFEWFGGRAKASHLIGTGGADDGFDWQMGFRGAVQYGVIQAYADAGDRGIEADNNEFDFEAPCGSYPTLANLTLVGPDQAGTTSNGFKLRRGTSAMVLNSIIQGWPVNGCDISEWSGLFGPDPDPTCGSDAAEGDLASLSGLDVRAYPNPATTSTTLSFSMAEAGRANVSIYDTQGRLVDRVADGDFGPGAHNVSWELPRDGASGTYFYRVVTGDDVATGRIFGVR
jgi:hypothetical protein